MVRYDDHAEFQIARRSILIAWIEQTLREPDLTEERGARRSFFKCLPGRRIMLRVVTPASDPPISTGRSHARENRPESRCRLSQFERPSLSESEEVADGIVVDYDTKGRVVGIEILDASKRAGNPETLKNYSFELPGVA